MKNNNQNMFPQKLNRTGGEMDIFLLYHGKLSRAISWQEQVAFDEMISALY
jgi:hypothetical protein